MDGTERSGTDARESGADQVTAEPCTPDCAIEESKPQMHMTKEMISSAQSARGRPADGAGQTGKALPAELQGHLGAHLRAVYGALINEPVPDKFFHLLKELEAKEKEGKS